MTTNIIVLIVDGFQADFVGAYGNSWIRTPELNRLAADGLLFDQAFVDTTDLHHVYRSLWSGQHASVRGPSRESTRLLPRLAAAGYHTQLITDEPVVRGHALAREFQQTAWLDHPPSIDGAASAEDLHETATAMLFADVLTHLARAREPFFTWVHAQGMSGPWDAPTELREQYLQDEEPEFNVEAKMADIRDAASSEVFVDPDDPDDLLALRLAYAAQVSLLDTCLGAFVGGLDEFPFAERTLFAVLGARGCGLGQHGRVGLSSPTLHEEYVHIPWIMRLPNRMGASTRSQALVQPMDLTPTLLDACGLPYATTSTASRSGVSLLPTVQYDRQNHLIQRDRILLIDSPDDATTSAALRTPGWYLIAPADADARDEGADGQRLELYTKPDDRWEVNEVSDRCPEIADALSQALHQLRESMQSENELPLMTLDPLLIDGLA